MDEIFDQLQAVVDRYDELNELISDPEVIADTQKFMKLSKEEADLRDTVAAYNKYKKVSKQLDDDEEMLREKIDDADLESMVKDEIADFKDQKQKLEDQLKVMLLPKDPNDDKNIIMEIHGAAGGDEGSLFAADLFSMYSKYAERQAGRLKSLTRTKPKSVGSRKSF